MEQAGAELAKDDEAGFCIGHKLANVYQLSMLTSEGLAK